MNHTLHTEEQIEEKINELIKEKLFFAIRKMIVQNQRELFIRTSEYKNSRDKNQLLNDYYKKSLEATNKFHLSLRSIYALHPLVKRELKIREFSSEEIIRVKIDYSYDGVDFSAYVPTHYNKTMLREIEDCIAELKDPDILHVVDNFVNNKDTERSPHEPLTTAELKYSAYYLFRFDPEYVSYLLSQIFTAKIITNPETSGWNIEDNIVEDIITVLNQKYSEEKVTQYKRIFTDQRVDRFLQECIRPMNISSDYFPKNIIKLNSFNQIDFQNDKEKSDAIKLYEFIFYITLATQMKNSIYDTSRIEIIAGSRKIAEQANIIIEGQKNWELLIGDALKRITSNDTGMNKQVVVLPEVKPDEILKPLDVYAFSYQSKRPPRYGVGRFITQIIEKYNIGSNKQHDIIIGELVESKSAFLIKSMIHPQENSIFLIDWLEKYLPSFLNLEYLSELEEKIKLVVANQLTLQSILNEVDRVISLSFEECGYVEENKKPSENKINLVKAIALKNKLFLNDEIYNSNAKLDMIIMQYPMAEPIRIGSCPECNAGVFQKEYVDKTSGEVLYYFSCENFKRTTGCSFSIWDSFIYNFFSNKSVELYTIEERAETLRKISKKKNGYLFTDLVAKNQKLYDAKIFLEQQPDKKTGQLRWGFGLKFINQKKH